MKEIEFEALEVWPKRWWGWVVFAIIHDITRRTKTHAFDRRLLGRSR